MARRDFLTNGKRHRIQLSTSKPNFTLINKSSRGAVKYFYDRGKLIFSDYIFADQQRIVVKYESRSFFFNNNSMNINGAF